MLKNNNVYRYMCHINQLAGPRANGNSHLRRNKYDLFIKGYTRLTNHKHSSTGHQHYLPHSNSSVAFVSESSML